MQGLILEKASFFHINPTTSGDKALKIYYDIKHQRLPPPPHQHPPEFFFNRTQSLHANQNTRIME